MPTASAFFFFSRLQDAIPFTAADGLYDTIPAVFCQEFRAVPVHFRLFTVRA
jgi:hypothetical protein